MERILIVLPNDVLGGAEQYLKIVAEFLYHKGFEVDVYFLKKRVSNAWDKLESERFRLHFTNSTREKKGIFRLLGKLIRNRRVKYKYVFTSHVHINAFISILRRLHIVKANYHIARESTLIFQRFQGKALSRFKTYYKIGYNNIDILICQTDYMYDQLRKALPWLFNRIRVKTIPNPVNLSSLKVKDERSQIVYQKYIVSAGRLIIEKGFDILIESFNCLRNDYPDMKLMILGEGQFRTQLEEKIIKLRLEHQVCLPGFKDNVFPYFRLAEMCVVSSRIEGFPNVLLQMMSQNEKVVSTKCAGGIEEIKGIVVADVNDVESLYLAMKMCLIQNTSANRCLFDEELKARSIENFMRVVDQEISELTVA